MAPETPADPVAAALAAIRERAKQAQWSSAAPPWSPHALLAADAPRLLAAVEAVLALADESHLMLANHETGQGEPVAWDLDPEALRAAISRELLSEEGGGG